MAPLKFPIFTVKSLPVRIRSLKVYQQVAQCFTPCPDIPVDWGKDPGLFRHQSGIHIGNAVDHQRQRLAVLARLHQVLCAVPMASTIWSTKFTNNMNSDQLDIMVKRSSKHATPPFDTTEYFDCLLHRRSRNSNEIVSICKFYDHTK